MFMKAVVLVVVVGAACAQLEQGIFAALYYPPAQVISTEAPPEQVHSTERPAQLPSTERHPSRVARSYFDRDAAGPRDGNNAVLRRVQHQMADPDWTPDVRPRHSWAA